MEVIKEVPRDPELKYRIEPLRSLLIQMYPIINDSHNLKHGLLLGILGDWGTGKTSLLYALESFFEDYMGYPAVFFDAWKYQEDPHPLISLVTKIKEKAQGRNRGNLTRAIKTIAKLALPVVDFGLRAVTSGTVGGGYGIKDIKKVIDDTGEFFLEYSSVYEKSHRLLKEAVSKFIKTYNVTSDPHNKQNWESFIGDAIQPGDSAEKHLIILVDDLDRLLPGKAIRIFELLRFYLLDIPDTVVIMAINDRILIPAIEKEFELSTGGDESKDLPGGKDFMEKVFHWTFEIPFVSWGTYGNYLQKTVFSSLEDCQFQNEMFDLFLELDPLSYRKWVRIKNRILSERRNGRINGFGDIWICALKECFPSIEWFLRDFPAFEEDLRKSNSLAELKVKYPQKLQKLAEKATGDNSVFKRPAENWQIFEKHR